MTTFKQWFDANLAEYAEDIANNGADAGFPHITYTNETVEIYDAHESEIYEMLNEDADSFGCKNVDEMVSTFSRSDMLSWPEGRKNLLVWYACERVAHELASV